ncbi:hypothetical protein GCM10008927_27660 [Amylibacter ulvae]|uniref:DoxX family protein n=1 Tax=Paramylibacter ulvae TaxID=1651968 RepID=A0ABQ3D639_9RHOB|nr:DoxX family protein [Amylibacter ulvae]GHA60590.1 hypothetical protein GCM10008927_27660 [Amylibacter ulvae]
MPQMFANIPKIIITLVLLGAGVAKLSGNPMMLESFTKLGLPDWFGAFIGTCEVAGAIGIWIRRMAAPAALGIAFIMVGAMYYHLSHTPMQQGIPALVIFLCAVYTFVRERYHAFWAG